MMRRSIALWRKYTPTEFVYTKNITAAGTRHMQVISCVHVFTLTRAEIDVVDKKFGNRPGKPIELAVFPLFDQAFPNYWHCVEEMCTTLKTDSLFCEGFTGEYVKRQPRPKPLYRFPYARWRDQKAPWPWGVAHPCKIHGGDLVDYSKIQRLFPSRRPGPDRDEERIQHCLETVDRVGLDYDSGYSAIAMPYRMAPRIAELLEEKQYVLLEKKEIEAGSTQNELYGRCMKKMVDQVNALMK